MFPANRKQNVMLAPVSICLKKLAIKPKWVAFLAAHFGWVAPSFLFSLKSAGKLGVCTLALAVTLACQKSSQSELQDAVDPINNKNYALGIKRLESLLEKEPENPRVYYYLGYAHLKKKEHRKAFDFVIQALVRDRDFNEVVGDAKLANFLAGNSESVTDLTFGLARMELEKIVAKNPKTIISDKILYHLAFYYLKKKEFEKAIESFNKVYAMEPNDTKQDRDSLLMITQIQLWELDLEPEGIKTLRILLEKYPQSLEAAEALFIVAEYKAKKMRIFQKRYDSLVKFAKRWKGDPALGTQAEQAETQAAQDLILVNDFKSQAVKGYKKIISEHKETRFYKIVNAKLAEL